MWSYLCPRRGLERSKLVRRAIKAKFKQIQRHLRFRGAKQQINFAQLLGRVRVTRNLTSKHLYLVSLQIWARKGHTYKVGHCWGFLTIPPLTQMTDRRKASAVCQWVNLRELLACTIPCCWPWDGDGGEGVAAHPGFTQGTLISTYTEPNFIIGTGVSWPPRSCSFFKDSTIVIHIVILVSLSPNDRIWGQDNFCHFMFYKSPHKCTWFSNNKKAIIFLNRTWIKCYEVSCSCYRGFFSK